MMKRQSLVIIVGGLPGDRELTFGSDGLLLVWELCCSLATSDDGTVLGNVFGGGGVLKKTFSTALSVFLLFSSILSLSLIPSPFPSPFPLLFALSLILFPFPFLEIFFSGFLS